MAEAVGLNDALIIGRASRLVGGDKADTLIVVDEGRGADKPRTVAVEFFGDKRNLVQAIRPNDLVMIRGNVTSREWQGKFYTTFHAWQVSVMLRAPQSQHREERAPPPARKPTPSPENAGAGGWDPDGDLPF